MFKGFITIISLILLAMFSCVDKRKIYVSGQIKDANTKKPIPNSEVLVLVWYKNMPFDRTVFKAHLLTDEYGRYEAYFPKGHKIDVAARKINYHAAKSVNAKKQHYHKIDVLLLEKTANDTINNTRADTSLWDFIMSTK